MLKTLSLAISAIMLKNFFDHQKFTLYIVGFIVQDEFVDCVFLIPGIVITSFSFN